MSVNKEDFLVPYNYWVEAFIKEEAFVTEMLLSSTIVFFQFKKK